MNLEIKTGCYDQGVYRRSGNSKKYFIQCAKGKKIYLFGCGVGVDYFLEFYGGKYYVEAIIDNDCTIHHTKYTYEQKEVMREIDIMGIEDLLRNNCNLEQIFIVITSLQYYLEIEEQLELLKIEHFVSLVLMERPQGLINKINVLFLKGYISIYDWFCMKIMCSTYHFREKRIRYKCYMHKEIQLNKIVVYDSLLYNEHPKYLVEYILKQNIPIDIVWITQNINSNFPEGIRVISIRNLENVMYELATAKLWITAFLMPPYLIKRKEQIYVHTKHWSSITLKKFGFDEPGGNKETLIARKWNGRNIDYIISGSEFDERTCKSGFRTNAQFLQFGSARSDVLFATESIREEISFRLGIKENMKVVLYAPTFRRKTVGSPLEGSNIASTLEEDLKQVEKIFNRKWGKDYIILLKLHPYVKKISRKICTSENVLDLSEYDDVQELILISDMIITDYSSLMFEPIYIKKPVFLYATDKEEFIKDERDFWLNFNELPFSFAESMEELEYNILEFDEMEYQQNIVVFMKKYGIREDGQASKRTVTFICELLDIKGTGE